MSAGDEESLILTQGYHQSPKAANNMNQSCPRPAHTHTLTHLESLPIFFCNARTSQKNDSALHKRWEFEGDQEGDDSLP